jgi:hypothetical protein
MNSMTLAPPFYWVAVPGDEIICPKGVILEILRPDGTKILSFPLPAGIYSEFAANPSHNAAELETKP